jgi:hypothetical protein
MLTLLESRDAGKVLDVSTGRVRQLVSDELTPFEPRTLHVHAYPRALQLKTDPPATLSLPKGTERSGRLRWIPVCSMPEPLRAAGGV